MPTWRKTVTDVITQILAQLEHQILPLLGVTHGSDVHGYDCCGCSTTYRLYDDVYTLVARHRQDHDEPAS